MASDEENNQTFVTQADPKPDDLKSLFCLINDLRSEVNSLKKNNLSPQINSRSTTCPVRPAVATSTNVALPNICTSPERENENDLNVEGTDEAPTINPYAIDTDGYETLGEDEEHEDIRNNIDYSKINTVDSDQEKSEAIVDEIAKIVSNNWSSRKSKESMNKLFDQYKSPQNCVLEPPKVNIELWKLLNALQKKSDIKFSSVQKSLIKALNAVLEIFKNVTSPNVDIQTIAQTTADIAAILGHASLEISLKRRTFIRNVINSDYKDVCSSTQPITENLFGDDLPKMIKEVNLTNKLQKKPQRRYILDKSYRYKPYQQPSQNSFLGRGRGDLPQRNRQRYHNNKENQKK